MKSPTFAVQPAVAAEMVTVSPRCAVAEPPACLAMVPVWREMVFPPTVSCRLIVWMESAMAIS